MPTFAGLIVAQPRIPLVKKERERERERHASDENYMHPETASLAEYYI